jgi:hypothetical protein
MGKMGAVASGGHTVLFVSHNTAAIEALCDRGVVLENGCVAFCGNQAEAVAQYHRASAGTGGEGRFSPAAGREPGAPPRARIVGATIANLESGEIGQVPAGGRVQVRVDCFASEPIDRPGLGIGIDSAGGQRIVTLHTNHDPTLLRRGRVRGAFSFSCTVELPLVPGNYTIKLNLESAEQTVHTVNQAMHFNILPAYGSAGRIGRGIVLCRQAWSLDIPGKLGRPSVMEDAG